MELENNTNHTPVIGGAGELDDYIEGFEGLIGVFERTKGDLRVELASTGDKSLRPTLDICDDIVAKIQTLQNILERHINNKNQ